MSIIDINQLGIKEWDLNDLLKSENLDFLELLVDDFSLMPSLGDQLELNKVLIGLTDKWGNELKQRQPTVYQRYQMLIKRLKILSLPSQKLEEIKWYLTNELKFILKFKIPLLTLLINFLSWDKPNFWVHLASFIKFFRENKEKLGSRGPFSFGKEGQPTIGEWISDYIKFTEGRPSKMDELSQADYFFKSEEVKKLTAEEKWILRRVLKLFVIFSNIDDHLDYYYNPYIYDSQLQTEETEESLTAKDEVKLDNFNKLKQNYQQSLKKIWTKYKIEEGLKSLANQSLPQLLNGLKDNLNQPQKLLPILIAINQQSISEKILENYPALFDLYNRQAVVDFKVKPSDFNLGYLYKIIFAKAHLTEAESAIIMQYLTTKNSNLFGYVYSELATGNFKWRRLELENNKIVFK